MKLLIVEDERELYDSIVSYLTGDDYLCEQAFTFVEAVRKVSDYEYDCILLDLMLPGGSGLEVLKTIKRQAPQTGVIIVSAKDSVDDKMSGLRMGADDYLAKPFYLPELGMRIFALMRRRNFAGDNVFRSGPVTIDFISKTVSVNGVGVELTRSEYDLLIFLVENRRRVVSKSALAEHINGDMADMMDDFNFVYAHIKNLKAKLAEAGAAGCIKTYYGTGYKWMENEKSAQ